MDRIDVGFCFYDDPDYDTDADRDSTLLREWHRLLWSKKLPGDSSSIKWQVEPGGYLTCFARGGTVRVSSDTIATTHSRYARQGMSELWAELSPAEQQHYDRAFYTIGGFVIFPVRRGSLNQLRGTDSRISDRFDLTLECIRQHYMGEQANPLAQPLALDAHFFGLFGVGASGFSAYVGFFHLQDMVAGNAIRWMDDRGGNEWDFASPPLPQSAPVYRRYLENVSQFVSARNARIRKWCDD
ncbi:hypothetical protein F0U44_00685 [Nocardioides humilatus]|uniref:Uncharacterized protein n=1 Tax=Nocardioides humilatus TaxID=2607660 RepID=A0A5B1LM75_9ACTN|nr:hypothetical protein [Nocardioides humilatus]KAA1420900.1 hypothetical protein F0U44_00685 [Nocardioides humilatus]